MTTIAPTWRTIDTAPKDGRRVLLCGGDVGDPVIGRWVDDYWSCETNQEGFEATAPTHWLEIPEVPT